MFRCAGHVRDYRAGTAAGVVAAPKNAMSDFQQIVILPAVVNALNP